ncbi:hypothetical protein E2C01_003499 [Portunus trituberculatus]|uniref:Uncharacterized protein n=1 Tax=Portunus trituberculatus TaxID=210409 RepID=A0A5B7CNU7_PORTR|nr:hypothetical protein [Portunus trituberculatus]
MIPRSWVVTPKMHLGGDMGNNMGTTITKISCATNGRKLSILYRSSRINQRMRGLTLLGRDVTCLRYRRNFPEPAPN